MKKTITLILFAFITIMINAQADKTSGKEQDKKGTNDKAGGQEQQGQADKTGGQSIKYTEGASGVRRSIHYKFSTVRTDNDPGNGIFRYNNDTVSRVTWIYVDNNDMSGEDQTNWYSTWDKATGATARGSVSVVEYEGKNVVDFDFTGVFVDGSGYWKFPVKFISGVMPSNGVVYYYIFNRIDHNKEQADKENQANKPDPETIVAAVVPVGQEPQPVPDAPPTEEPLPVQVVQPIQEPQPVQVVQPIQEPQPVQVTQPIQEPQPVQVVQPIQEPQPVQVAQPIQEPQPVQVVQPIQEPQPVQVAQPIQEPQPVQVVQPIQEPQPVQVAQPIQEPQPVQVVQPIQEPQPVQVAQPIQEPQPVQIVQPIQEPQPVQVSQPIQEPEPVQVTQPAEKPQPIEELQPLKDQKPVQRTKPAITTQPTQKTQPAQPAVITQPAQTTQPAGPTLPAQTTQQPQPTPAVQATRPAQTTQAAQPAQNAPSQQPEQTITAVEPVQNNQPAQTKPEIKVTNTSPTTQTGQYSNKQASNQYSSNTLPNQSNIYEKYLTQGVTTRRKCYSGIIEAGYALGIGKYGINNFRFNFINGFKIGNSSSIGLGIGYRRYFENYDFSDISLVSGEQQVPVFIDLRTNFSTKKITPYVAIGFGGSAGLTETESRQEGLFFTASGGIWFNITDRFAIFGGIAYELQRLEYLRISDATHFNKNASSISLNIGISF